MKLVITIDVQEQDDRSVSTNEELADALTSLADQLRDLEPDLSNLRRFCTIKELIEIPGKIEAVGMFELQGVG